MKRKPQNIIFHELIGLRVEVVSHSDPSLIGIKGTIVDETRNTLIIKTPRGERKRILKLYGVFKLYLDDGVEVVIDGSSILGRPEERLKRILK